MKIVHEYVAQTTPDHYTESGQSNPIRFNLGLYDKETDTFKQILPQFKCRDYFNDVSYLYTRADSRWHKKLDRIYGFPAGLLPYEQMREQGGIYILLTNLRDGFKDNVKNFLYPFLEQEKVTDWPWFSSVCTETQEDAGILCFIPEFFLKHTFRISLITFLIRICNNSDITTEGAREALPAPDGSYWTQFAKYFHKTTWYVERAWEGAPVLTCDNKYGADSGLSLMSIHNTGFLAAMQQAHKDICKLGNNAPRVWSFGEEALPQEVVAVAPTKECVSYEDDEDDDEDECLVAFNGDEIY